MIKWFLVVVGLVFSMSAFGYVREIVTITFDDKTTMEKAGMNENGMGWECVPVSSVYFNEDMDNQVRITKVSGKKIIGCGTRELTAQEKAEYNNE